MARETFLPFARPCIGPEEAARVARVLDSDWITTGPTAKQFEAAIASYLGVPNAVALNSCTAALHTALLCLGVGPADEVITTPLTFAATVNVIEHVGARPVLADVEADTLNLDPERAEQAVTARTRAILPVHYGGHPVELDAFKSIVESRGLTLLEDAAHALAARYRGRLIGSDGNPVAFSFYATKNLTTAEGGLLTGGAGLLERARVLSLHGMSGDAWKRYGNGGTWMYDVVRPGFKYNMPDILAALGLAQLSRLDAFQVRRRAVAEMYGAALGAEEALEVPTPRPHVEPAWHLYPVRLRLEALTIDRTRFIEELRARNIGTSVHFIPIHLHSYYRDKYGYRPADFPVSLAAYERLVSLPLDPGLSDADVGDVCEAVRDVIRCYRR